MIEVTCDECSGDVEEMFCQKHMDEKLQEAYDNGRTEGFEEGQKSVQPKD